MLNTAGVSAPAFLINKKMIYNYQGLTKEGGRVTLTTWITFEGKPVMQVEEFHDIKKMGTVNPYLVVVTNEYPQAKRSYNRKPLESAKVTLWLHPDEIRTMINNFKIIGPHYFYHLKFESVS